MAVSIPKATSSAAKSSVSSSSVSKAVPSAAAAGKAATTAAATKTVTPAAPASTPKPTAQATAAANQQILQAKEEYQAALERGDRAAMDAARTKADALRTQGGTIGADKTLEQARAIVSTPSPVPAPASTITTYNAQGQKSSGAPSQQELNRSLEKAKQEWWDAKFKGDQTAMDNAAKQGQKLRADGAQETDAIRKLDAENTVKLQTEKQNSLNKDLENSKQLWWEARLKNDKAGMDAASSKGDSLRLAGAQDTEATAKLDAEYLIKLKAIQETNKQLEQKKMNDQLVAVKEKWWIARLHDLSQDMTSAQTKGQALRDKGAIDTEQSRAIDEKYSLLLQDKLSNERKLLEEKKKWWDAKINLSTTGMDAAKKAADNLRGKAYVNDHTAEMVNLEKQNQEFLNAKVSYYSNIMDMSATDRQKALDAMKTATAHGASLNVNTSYRLDEVNNKIIEYRKDYWRERANYDIGANQVRAKENAYRNQFGDLSSLLITDGKYKLDSVANDIIYKTEVRWNEYANYTQKELSNLKDNDKAIQDSIRQMNNAVGTVFTKTKLDVVNEQIIGLRKQYWNAVDQYKDTAAIDTQLKKVLKDNSQMGGLLIDSKQESVNREYRANRDALNKSLTAGNHDQSIHFIRFMQQITEQSGSDLTIRRSGAVSQQSVDNLMVHIKSQEWDNLVNLRSDEGNRLAKAKTAVRNNLLANIDSAAIKELDKMNFVILSAKRDYWQGVSSLSTSAMEQAKNTLTSAANSKYSSLSASLDTAYDRLFRDGIEINLLEWSGEGNTSKESELTKKREAWTKSVNAASSLTNSFMGAIGQSFTIKHLDAGTGLDQTLRTIYQNKGAQWENVARYGTEIEPLNTSIAANMRSIQNVLDIANKQTAKDLTLPAFALDQANDRVLKDRTEIMKAIENGERGRAQALFNQGLSRQSEGATLRIWELVPDLNAVNWNRMSEEEAMKFKIDYTIEYVNSKFTAKEIKDLQTNLAKMKIYEGPITGKYDKQTYAAVYGYHMLLENDARATIWKNDGVDLGKEGVVTKDLIKFAIGDVGLDRKNTNKYEINSNNLVKAVTIFGIGDGMVSQLAEDGVDFLNAAVQMNPTNLSFWTKTLPEAWSLAKGIATGEITPKELFGELKDSLKQEFIDPFTYIKNHQNVMNGNSTYEEAREFGKNLMRAVEVVAAAVSLGAAGVAKLASKMPKLVGGIKELIKDSPNKVNELEERVVGKGLAASVLKFEDEIRFKTVEHGQFFKKNGDKIGDTIVGTEKKIDLSNYKHLAKDAIFTHNHPTNGPFSLEDIVTAVDFDMAEIRAVSPNGSTLSMKRGSEGWKVSSEELKDVMREAQNEVRNDPRAQEMLKSGNNLAVWDMLFTNLSNKIGGEFSTIRK